MSYREFFANMGEAVAKRTILRRVPDTTQQAQYHTVEFPHPLLCGRVDLTLTKWLAENDLALPSPTAFAVDRSESENTTVVCFTAWPARDETWGDLAHRVALGNSLLTRNLKGFASEAEREDHLKAELSVMEKHLRSGGLLMSGRHLQHGDETQPMRRLELFSNCSTSTLSSLEFYLLLSGSGVGQDYSDHMQIIDWSRHLPIVEPVIDADHPDALLGLIKSWTLDKAMRFYSNRKVTVFHVPDSREGWRQALETIENMTFEGNHHDEVLLLDFSDVRCKGTPIAGMQGRPASGPADLMVAIYNIAKLRDSGMAPWRASCHVDHYLAECVLVGGARRAARMAVKYWKDPDILEFIGIKKTCDLWSANNSVLVDAEFWAYVNDTALVTCTEMDYSDVEMSIRARKVMEAITSHAYFDNTGEPGLINVDKLEWKADGIEHLTEDNLLTDDSILPATRHLMKAKYQAWLGGVYQVIVNPCAEILLSSVGGFCVIADLAPYLSCFGLDTDFLSREELHHLWDAAVIESAQAAARALIRVNTLPSIYGGEVARTNRIGVSMTGIHEYALVRFGFQFEDLLDDEKSATFWQFIAKVSTAVQDAARDYCHKHGLVVPHTSLTIKPSGCMDPETHIRTNRGVYTLRAIFEANGYDLTKLSSESNRWLPLTVPFSVYDKDNNLQPITALYLNGVSATTQINLSNGAAYWCSPSHKFLTLSGEWIEAVRLTTDTNIVNQTAGSVQPLIAPINDTPRFTVDIEVANTHSYQLECGTVAHNTISKLFGLTEGAHLPSRRHYLRWVQFREDSDRLQEFIARGYPTRELKTYKNTTIVGFPTEPLIYSLPGSESYPTADDVTPDQHYQWLRNLEKWWINGYVFEDGTLARSGRGNQVSYTLKYNPKLVSYSDFCDTLRRNQPSIRCCAVAPHVDLAYEYTPEQDITRAEYENLLDIVNASGKKLVEDVDLAHVDCSTQACPIDFKKDTA